MKSQKLAKHRSFNFIVIVVIFCCSLLIPLLNLVTDPYGIMGSPAIAGFNKLKPGKADYYRVFKAVDVIRLKPKTIYIGTSTMDFGLDGNHPAIATRPGYNLGIPGTNMFELMRYFEHALYNQPDIKQVIISADTFIFDKYRNNSKDYDGKRLGTNTLTYQDILNANFSMNAFLSSVKTIEANLKNSNFQPYDVNGARDENWFVDNKPPIYRFIRSINREIHEVNVLSEERFNNLKRIIDICRERNIDVKVFIPPIHAIVTEGRYFTKKIIVTEQEKRQLVKIIPTWDFSGFNSITTEKVSNNQKNYIDAYHYRKNVGNLVLNRILHFHEETVPDDFGFLMTAENIEAHFTETQNKRTEWQSSNPELVKLLQDLEYVKGV